MQNKIIILTLFFIFFSCFDRREKLLKQDTIVLIEKIEDYKKLYGKIPPDLKSIGVDEKEEGPIFYTPWNDSINYIIYFSEGGVGESKKYYSDTKKWENIDRGIN